MVNIQLDRSQALTLLGGHRAVKSSLVGQHLEDRSLLEHTGAVCLCMHVCVAKWVDELGAVCAELHT